MQRNPLESLVASHFADRRPPVPEKRVGKGSLGGIDRADHDFQERPAHRYAIVAGDLLGPESSQRKIAPERRNPLLPSGAAVPRRRALCDQANRKA